MFLLGALCGFMTYCTPPYRYSYYSWQSVAGSLIRSAVQMGKGNMSSGRHVLWSRVLPDGIDVSVEPVVGDINNDGQMEIVVSEYANASPNNRLYALNAITGDTIWSVPNYGPEYHYFWGTPTIADVDGDDTLEVLAGNYDGYLYIINGVTGSYTRLWIGGDVPYSEGVGDVDGDGKPEIVVTSNNSVLDVFNGEDLSLLWSKNIRVYTPPALADVDGDRDMDVVVGGNEKLWAYDGATGTLLWIADTTTAPITDYFHYVAVYDIDGDGKMEVVATNEDWYVYAFNGEDGSFLWRANVGGRARTYPAIYDIDGDGTVEVITGSSRVPYNNFVRAFNGPDGALKWEAVLAGRFQGSGVGPVVVDIDPSPGYEVVINGEETPVYVLSSSGNLLWADTTIWAENSAVADVDGDGCVEIVEVGRNPYNVAVIDASSGSCPLGGEGGLSTYEERGSRSGPVSIYTPDGRRVSGAYKRGIYFIVDKGRVRKVVKR